MPGYQLTSDWRSTRITTPAVRPQTTYVPKPTVAPAIQTVIQPTVAQPRPVQPIIKKDPDTALLPTPMSAVDVMLRLVSPEKDQVVYDLGAGDGRIVIHSAKLYGTRGVGVEINPETVRKAKERVKRLGVEDLVTIVEDDILKYDFQEADIITIFLFPDLIEKLVPLIKKPGTVVISANHDIPGKKTSKRIVGIDGFDTEFFIWYVE